MKTNHSRIVAYFNSTRSNREVLFVFGDLINANRATLHAAVLYICGTLMLTYLRTFF